jgi:8-oxo-dGTP diphosphatase
MTAVLCDISIQLIPYTARYLSGTLTLREHKTYRFLQKEELEGVDWAAADVGVVREMVALIKNE